jgi:hypothetical protein
MRAFAVACRALDRSMSEADSARRARGPARVLAALVRGYQLAISPMLRPSCRFAPSCSEYAYESLVEHGALRGSWLALRRLLRCHPFHAGGYDPVPPSSRRHREPGESGQSGEMIPSPSEQPEAGLVPALSSKEAGDCPC